MEDERRFAWLRGNPGLIGLLLGIFILGPALLYLQFSGIFPLIGGGWQPKGAQASAPIAGTLAPDQPSPSTSSKAPKKGSKKVLKKNKTNK